MVRSTKFGQIINPIFLCWDENTIDVLNLVLIIYKETDSTKKLALMGSVPGRL